MKNGLLIWNVVLSLVAGYLLFMQFKSKKSTATETKIPVSDTATNKFRMAYFEMDSVESNFMVVKDVKEEIDKKDIEYNNSINQLDQAFKNKYNEYSQKGSMTTEETEAAQVVLKQLSDSVESRKQELTQKYQDFRMRINLDIKNKIEDFIRGYNKTKGYSFIVTDDTGLFYFKDSVYNITSEVIKGLNEFYKSKQK